MGKVWKTIRDTGESALSLGGNFLLPGSGALTSQIMSKGSQKQLASPLGQVGMIGSGLAGSGALQALGNAANISTLANIPTAASMGAGWGNLLSGAGKLGSSISNGLGFGSGVDNATYMAAPITSVTSSALPAATQAASSAASSGGGFLGSMFNGANGYGIPSVLGGVGNYLTKQQAEKDLLKSQQQAAALMQPYLNTGNASNTALAEAMGLGGNPNAAGYGALTKPFSMGDFTTDPGYQFRLAEGQKALDRRQTAGGNYFSGAALKEAQDFGQGLANQTYQDAYNRYTQNQNNLYNKLASQSQLGTNVANQMGDIYTNMGKAKAASSVGTGNILSSTLSSLLGGGREGYLKYLPANYNYFG